VKSVVPNGETVDRRDLERGLYGCYTQLLSVADVRGGRIVDGPDTGELVQLVRTEDAAVTGQVLETVRDDRHEQIQHLTADQLRHHSASSTFTAASIQLSCFKWSCLMVFRL